MIQVSKNPNASSNSDYNYSNSLTTLIITEAFNAFVNNGGKKHKFNGELAQILNLSIDTVVKKTNGTNAFTISDLDLIAKHMRLDFMVNNSASKAMKMNLLRGSPTHIFSYFEGIANQLKQLSTSPSTKIVLTAEDIPIFYYFAYPELLKLKLFYYQYTLYPNMGMLERNFIGEEQLENLKSLFTSYKQIASKELWTPRTLDGTISQFIYLVKIKRLTDKLFIKEILEELKQLIVDVFTNAKAGKKGLNGADIQMFHSNISLSNTEIYVKQNDMKMGFISMNTFNSITIMAGSELDEVIHWIDHMFESGTIISVHSPELRENLKDILMQKIDQLETTLKEL
ncbi:MAG: hypothetical protein HYZ42_15865 [Bacteroidetes bacterium]|nr:hypothetical protein [Bacteroidota bacterium]